MAYRIAIIGAGDIVRKAYLPTLASRADCRVMAICSQSGLSARELATQYDIPVVSLNYQEFLKRNEVDVVFICTPTGSHRPIAEAVIASHKHLMVEKPLCTTYEDSHALLKKAARYDRVFYPAFNNRFREENQYFIQRILAGEIGLLEIIDFEWYRRKRNLQKPWLYDLSLSGGGVLIDLGAHLVHMALDLIPERETFSAACFNYVHQPKDSQVEDTSTSLICIDQKVSIFIKLGWDMNLPTASRVDLQVFGQKGLTSNREYQDEKTDGYVHMIQDFFNLIEANTQPDLHLVDDTMFLLDRLYRSTRKGGSVSGRFIKR